MGSVRIDQEGEHLASLLRLVDPRGLRVLEIGCGDGRLTRGLAPRAASVLALDLDPDAVARGAALGLGDHVRFVAASAASAEIPRGAFDLAVFSWSY